MYFILHINRHIFEDAYVPNRILLFIEQIKSYYTYVTIIILNIYKITFKPRGKTFGKTHCTCAKRRICQSRL